MKNFNWLVKALYYFPSWRPSGLENLSKSLNSEKSILYDVTFMPQEHANMCGDACLAMLAKFRTRPFFSLENNPRSVALGLSITNVLSEIGCAKADLDVTAPNVYKFLQETGPFIFSIPMKGEAGHFCIAVGCTETHLIYHDPLDKAYRCISFDDFLRSQQLKNVEYYKWVLGPLPEHPKKGTIYIEKTPKELKYKVINPQNAEVSGQIDGKTANLGGNQLTEKTLKQLAPKILKEMSGAGHSYHFPSGSDFTIQIVIQDRHLPVEDLKDRTLPINQIPTVKKLPPTGYSSFFSLRHPVCRPANFSEYYDEFDAVIRLLSNYAFGSKILHPGRHHRKKISQLVEDLETMKKNGGLDTNQFILKLQELLKNTVFNHNGTLYQMLNAIQTFIPAINLKIKSQKTKIHWEKLIPRLLVGLLFLIPAGVGLIALALSTSGISLIFLPVIATALTTFFQSWLTAITLTGVVAGAGLIVTTATGRNAAAGDFSSSEILLKPGSSNMNPPPVTHFEDSSLQIGGPSEKKPEKNNEIQSFRSTSTT